MADVIWQNGTWTYGNWGGAGWSGLIFTAPGQPVDRTVGAVDKLDEVFKDHDISYENAQKANDDSVGSIADQVRLLDSKILADEKLLRDVNGLRFGDPIGDPPYLEPGSGGAHTAAQATVAFVAKLKLERANRAAFGVLIDPGTFLAEALFPAAPGIAVLVRLHFDDAIRWFLPRDPLVLDLDGDGVELTGTNSAVLFDHNADTAGQGNCRQPGRGHGA